MKLAVLTFAALSLGVAGAAVAAERLSDVDYLKANRCRGLAAGLSADTTTIDALIKREGLARMAYLQQRGEDAAAKGRRDAARASDKARLSAELSGACAPFLGEPSTVASGSQPVAR